MTPAESRGTGADRVAGRGRLGFLSQGRDRRRVFLYRLISGHPRVEVPAAFFEMARYGRAFHATTTSLLRVNETMHSEDL